LDGQRPGLAHVRLALLGPSFLLERLGARGALRLGSVVSGIRGLLRARSARRLGRGLLGDRRGLLGRRLLGCGSRRLLGHGSSLLGGSLLGRGSSLFRLLGHGSSLLGGSLLGRGSSLLGG